MKKEALIAALALTIGTFVGAYAHDASAQDDAFKALFAARSLKCEIGPGTAAKWSDAKISLAKDSANLTVHFDSVDVKSGKARLIGNQGAGDVAVWGTASGITFVEMTGFGNLVITTVFPQQIRGRPEFYAVMSRHIAGFGGNPIPSQYHGSCKVWPK